MPFKARVTFAKLTGTPWMRSLKSPLRYHQTLIVKRCIASKEIGNKRNLLHERLLNASYVPRSTTELKSFTMPSLIQTYSLYSNRVYFYFLIPVFYFFLFLIFLVFSTVQHSLFIYSNFLFFISFYLCIFKFFPIFLFLGVFYSHFLIIYYIFSTSYILKILISSDFTEKRIYLN